MCYCCFGANTLFSSIFRTQDSLRKKIIFLSPRKRKSIPMRLNALRFEVIFFSFVFFYGFQVLKHLMDKIMKSETINGLKRIYDILYRGVEFCNRKKNRLIKYSECIAQPKTTLICGLSIKGVISHFGKFSVSGI